MLAGLLYGAGLHLMECLRLRVKDLDFKRRQITVRERKGDRDRATLLPGSLSSELQSQLEHIRTQFDRDHNLGQGGVFLPHALERKYPRAPYEWAWHWLFPSSKLSLDPRPGIRRRHHTNESGPHRAIRHAAARAKIPKRVSPHSLRQFLRDSHAGRRRRHSNRPDPTRSPGPQDDHDLHPHPGPRPTRRHQPTRQNLTPHELGGLPTGSLSSYQDPNPA